MASIRGLNPKLIFFIFFGWACIDHGLERRWVYSVNNFDTVLDPVDEMSFPCVQRLKAVGDAIRFGFSANQ